MQSKFTSRGFKIIEFEDGNQETCTIQESSAAREEGLIWLGAKRLDIKVMCYGKSGWSDLDIKAFPYVRELIGNQRMHLTQSNVRELLPVLEYFAEH